MKKNVTKIALLLIAAVMLVSIAFAGAASAADPIVIDSQENFTKIFGNKTTLTTDGYYKFTGDWELSPTNFGNTVNILTINSNVTLDFSEFTGTFAGIETTMPYNLGCLFGTVKIGVDKTLEIKNLNITSAKIINSGRYSVKQVGVIIGGATLASTPAKTGTGILKFTDCTLENCKISLPNNGGNDVGGLIGYTGNNLYLKAERCTLNHCEVGHPKCTKIGGMAGYVIGDDANSFSDCTIMNSIIYGNTYVGGIVGAVRVIDCEGCNIKNTIICSMADTLKTDAKVGGLIGGGSALKSNAKATAVGCEVTNSLVGSKGINVGGLIGDSAFDYAGNATIDGCSVRKSTIVGSSKAGGLVGGLSSSNLPILFKGANKVENSSVRGTNSDTYTKLVIGSGTYEGPSPIADVNTNFLNNNSQSDTITLYDINGDVINPGDPSFEYTLFNSTGQKANGEETEVTHLGTYGTSKGYGVITKYLALYDGNGATSGSVADNTGYDKEATVTVKGPGDLAKTGYLFNGWNTKPDGTGTSYAPGDTFTITEDTTLYAQWLKDYGILITNATGTYRLNEAMTKVYGDYAGATNGTVTVSEDANGNPVLTLENFVATNTSNVPIINLTDVPKLRIELKGESSLTASVLGGNTMGTVCGDGNNLTITNQTGELNGKLIVTNSGQNNHNGILLTYSSSALTVSNVNLTVFGEGDLNVNAIAAADVVFEGPTTVVNAYVKSDAAGYAIVAGGNLEIKSDCVVNAYADSRYASIAITGTTTQIVDTGCVVEAYAKSSVAYACAISARDELEINGAAINATAEGYAGSLEYPTAALRAHFGNITITGGATVEANATSSTGFARSICAGDPSDLPYAPECSIYIDDESTVETHAKSNGKEAYAVWAVKDLEIKSAAEVNATAVGNDLTSALSAETGNITIDDAGKIEAHAASSHHNGQAMYANNDVKIVSSEVNATAVSTAVSGDDPGSNAYAFISGQGNISIKDATVDADAFSTNNTAVAILAKKKIELTAKNLINAHAKGKTMSSALDITSESGNILIDGDSTITAIADGEYGIAIDGFGATISILDCEKIIAEGTNTSFGVLAGFGNFDIAKLEKTHKFLNASTSLTYDQLCNDWHVEEFPIRKGIPFNISNYTAVTIKKKTTFSSSSSSGSNGGATVILTETPTQAPTAEPTPVATIQPVGNATIKPTQSTTSKSPAPFAGLAAGLGAALAIARLRR